MYGVFIPARLRVCLSLQLHNYRLAVEEYYYKVILRVDCVDLDNKILLIAFQTHDCSNLNHRCLHVTHLRGSVEISRPGGFPCVVRFTLG